MVDLSSPRLITGGYLEYIRVAVLKPKLLKSYLVVHQRLLSYFPSYKLVTTYDSWDEPPSRVLTI